MTTATLKDRDHYLAQFEQFERELGERDQPWLRRIRKAAIARFAALGFPGPRHEDWKFTNLTPLRQVSFERSPYGVASEPLGISRDPGPAIAVLIINGTPYVEERKTKLPEGVIVCSLAEALQKYPALVEEHLARHADSREHVFTALNTAFLTNGAFIFVRKGKVLDHPIRIEYVNGMTGLPVMWNHRALIVAERESQATIIETFSSRKEKNNIYWTNAVTELVLGPNATLDHYKLQAEGDDAFHIANTLVHQSRTSNFSTHYIGLGGKLVRNEVRVVFDGEGSEATVNGLYRATGTQHMDNFTVIDHAKPHCTSHELYKGILDGRAHGVFNGKIFVRQDAQKTDAKQTNKTLLLSDDAVINTKPQLEIYADDVKCTHGATVGQLDADAIFYLQSRGIGREEARSLLTFAFANDILGRIKAPSLRRELEELFLSAQHLPADPLVEEAL